MHFTVRIFFAISLLLLAACQGVQFREDELPLEPSYARPAANEGPLADLAEHFTRRLGPEHSGFRLLDSSYDSLAWRLALIDSATTSLDIQTYLWYPDHSGRLLLQRAIDAALRGVHVRLVDGAETALNLPEGTYEIAVEATDASVKPIYGEHTYAAQDHFEMDFQVELSDAPVQRR
mgnify:CR=1 FL=1